MATELKRWIGGTLAACILVAAGLLSGGEARLPPREQPTRQGDRWVAEAARLAGVWRTAWGRWRLEAYRDALTRPADSARTAGGSAPLLLIDGPSTPAQRAELNGYLAEMWRQAAPEGFKVAVALVIVRDAASGAGAKTPTLGPKGDAPTYLFPDSLHRDMCLAVVHESFTGRLFFDRRRTRPVQLSQALRWLAESIGPCVFYGAYGIPGREIGRWLRGQGFQFAIYPRWWRREPDPWLAFFYYGDHPTSRQPWEWWVSMYSRLPWGSLACYGERRSQCSTAVFDSAALADSQPTFWNSYDWWRGQGFFSGVTYLSDLASSLGPARFSALWGGDIPLDSAVHLATGQTLGDWTLAWARRTGPEIRVGASAPPLDVGLGLLPALIALGATLWYARRRQIG